VVASRRSILFFTPAPRGGGHERLIVTLLHHLDREHFCLALTVMDVQKAVHWIAMTGYAVKAGLDWQAMQSSAVGRSCWLACRQSRCDVG
jgi:hypothetical protein